MRRMVRGLVLSMLFFSVYGSVPAAALSSARPAVNRPNTPDYRTKQRQEATRRDIQAHSDASGRVRPDLSARAAADFARLKIGASRPVTHGTTPIGAKPSSAAPLTAAGGGGVTGVQWTQIGPAPLEIDAEQNFQGLGPDAGQVTDISIDPRNATDQTFYESFNDGGVWKGTLSGGTFTWAPKTDYMPSLSMGAVVEDPGNPSILYAGTGNLFNNGFYRPVGVYKSIDAGDTWSVLAGSSFLTTAVNNRGSSGVGVNKIVMPAPGVLMLATNGGLFRSVDGGASFGNNAPNFNNSQPILGGLISDLRLDTAFNGGTNNTVYAAQSGQGIFVSTDGGQTFPSSSNLLGASHTNAPSSFGYLTMAQSTSPDNQTIYVDWQATSGTSGFGGMIKSVDTGATWSLPLAAAKTRGDESGNNGSGCQCGYDQTMGVDPQNATRVYIGFQQLYRSDDGGGSFSNVSDGKIHWDHHALIFSPAPHRATTGSPGFTRVYVGNDGGAAYSDDGGSNWVQMNRGIATNLFRGIDIGRGAANNGFTYGGSQDTGNEVHRPCPTVSPCDSGTVWRLNQDGDGGPVAVDWTNPLNAYGNDDGGFSRTTDGGLSWTGGAGFPICTSVSSVPAVDPNTGIVYLAVVTQPNDGGSPAKCISGTNTNAIYRSTDHGANFAQVATFTQPVITMANVQVDSNTLWVGFPSGGLSYTQNLGAASPTFTNVNIASRPGGQGVSGIAIDPSNTARAVVVYQGFSGISLPSLTRHVFMTTDNGGNWSDIGGTLRDATQMVPDQPVYSVVIDPGTTPHSIIASTDSGVLRTQDNGQTWQVLGVGLPTVNANSLQIDSTVSPSLLRLGTYGRSSFELTSANGPLLAVNSNLAYGIVPVGSSASRVAQLFNVGSTDLHINGISLQSGSTDFSLSSGAATPVVIHPGGELDYTFSFAPSAAGNETATFQINSDDQFQPARLLALSGTGGVPRIAVTGNLQFGVVPRGTTATLPVDISNTGNAPLSVSGVTFPANPNFTVVGPTTPQTLAPGSDITFNIQFNPPASSAGGPVSSTLSIASNDPSTPTVTLPASGTIGIPVLVVSGSLNFGTVARGYSANQNITLNNTGQAPLHVTSVAFNGASDPSFSVVSPSSPPTIPAGSSVDYTIKFAPPSNSGPGTRTGTLVVLSDDPANPSVTVNARGDVGVPSTVLSSNALNFGSVAVDNRTNPSSSTQVLRITNQASCPGCDVNVTSLPITGPNAADFTIVGGPTLPARIGAGSELDLTVSFDPSAPGTRAATLTVNTDDPINPSQAVSLTGVGLIPAIGFATSPLIFGPTVYDPQCSNFCGVTRSEVVTNIGAAELILDALGVTTDSGSTGSAFFAPGATSPATRLGLGGAYAWPITFRPSGGPSRAIRGTATVTDLLPFDSPMVQASIPLCGESVGRGIRVLVVDNHGNPVSNVTRLQLKSNGVSGGVNVNSSSLPLTTIAPPTSCQQIMFHYENQALPATDAAHPSKSYYTLSVRVGNQSMGQTFTLGVNEFKLITVTMP